MITELNRSDFQEWAPNQGGREARPYETLTNLQGRGVVYPRQSGTDHCSNLAIGMAQFRLKIVKIDRIHEF
jgi:hypothetical protein